MYGGPYLRMKVFKEVELSFSGRVCFPEMARTWLNPQHHRKRKKSYVCYHEDPGRFLPEVHCDGYRYLGTSLSSDKPSCPTTLGGSDHSTVSHLQPVPRSQRPLHHLPQAPQSLKRLPRSLWACRWKAAKRISSQRAGPAPPWVGSPSQAARLQGASRRWWPCPQSWTHTPSPRESRRFSRTTT